MQVHLEVPLPGDRGNALNYFNALQTIHDYTSRKPLQIDAEPQFVDRFRISIKSALRFHDCLVYSKCSVLIYQDSRGEYSLETTLRFPSLSFVGLS
jgi:hypothetical protein